MVVGVCLVRCWGACIVLGCVYVGQDACLLGGLSCTVGMLNDKCLCDRRTLVH